MPQNTIITRSSRPYPFLQDLHVEFIRNLDNHKETVEYWTISHLKLNGVYWGLVALYLMGKEDALPKENIIDFVKSCHNIEKDYGFGGNVGHDSHLIYTLSAIQILAICGRSELINEIIDRDRLLYHIATLHDPIIGSFKGDEWGEIDTRFSYISIQILALLGYIDTKNGSNNKGKLYPKKNYDNNNENIPYIDLDKTLEFIQSCQNFDGGYGTVPGSESHSGQIFCCISALSILNRLDLVSSISRSTELKLKTWLAQRQTKNGGLNGRPEKLEDVCYSWWVLSSMSILNIINWIDREKVIDFILKSQDDETGGIADRPGDYPDVFHCNFGICGLSLLGYEGLKEIDPSYCLPKDIINSLGL